MLEFYLNQIRGRGFIQLILEVGTLYNFIQIEVWVRVPSGQILIFDAFNSASVGRVSN